MKTDLPVKFRGPHEGGDDTAFVLSSWLKSARTVGDARAQCNAIYYAGKRAQIVRAMRRPNTKVVIAGDEGDEKQIYGWACVELGTIHYVYVKLAFRGFGLAQRLLHKALDRFSEVETTTTALCRDFDSYARAFRLQFNPYLLEAP